MYLNLLLAFALLTALLFAVPVRWKAPITAVVTAILSVAAAVPAVKALASGSTTEITRMQGPVFGEESIAVDPLSGLFLIIIAVTSVAAVLYSCGYMKHYYGKKPPVQFSLHYTAFAALVALDVASDYLSCTPDEQALQLKRGADLCLYVGSACTEYQLGLCQTKTETYCCYHSPLARLIHEAAKEQLGLTENPTAPTCRGLTAQEFAKLDLSRIPLDELRKAMGAEVSDTTDAEHIGLTLMRAGERKVELETSQEPYAPMPGKTGVTQH